MNTFETSRVELELDGQNVTVTQTSLFPRKGEGNLTFHMAKPTTFTLLVRVPEWMKGPPWNSQFELTVNGEPSGSERSHGDIVDCEAARMEGRGPRRVSYHARPG